MSLLQKSESIELSRRRQRFNAHSDTYTGSNNPRVRINIDVAEEHLDFENSYLAFDLAVTGGTTHVGLPRYSASSWIKEIRWKDRAGNQLGENLQDYNVYSRVQLEMMVSTDQEASYLEVLEGSQGTTIAAAVGTTIAARQYCHRMVSHLGAMKNYFPAKYLGGLILEIDMVAPSKVVLQTTTESGADYVITNLRFVAELVKLKPEVEGAILNAVASNGLVVDYVSAHTIKGEVAATAASKRFDLGTMNGRVKAVEAVQVANNSDRAVDTNDAFSRNNAVNYRWRLGSRYLSESQVEMSATKQAEVLMEYLKAKKLTNEPLGLYGKTANTPAILLSNRFVIGQNVDRSKSDEVLSSLKDKDNNRLELELNYSGAASAAALYVFAQLDKRVRIMAGKQFVDDDFSGQGTIMAT